MIVVIEKATGRRLSDQEVEELICEMERRGIETIGEEDRYEFYVPLPAGLA
jgi:hypothetical protein